MKTKGHTPGPWRSAHTYSPEAGTDAFSPYIVDGSNPARNVAAVLLGERAIDDAEIMANAWLIAQAPTLLAQRDKLLEALATLADPDDLIHLLGKSPDPVAVSVAQALLGRRQQARQVIEEVRGE